MTPFTLEKLKARLDELREAPIRAVRPIADVETCPAPGRPPENAMAPPPPPDAPAWRPLRAGERWGGDPEQPDGQPRTLGWGIPADGGHTHWLRARVAVPEEWRGRSVALHLAGEGEGQWQASLEAILYLDGKALAGIDQFHRSAVLPPEAHTGEHEALLRVYTSFARPFGGLELQLRDEAIMQLAAAFWAIVGAVETFQESHPARHALLAAINAAYNRLDLRAGWRGEQFAESAYLALDELRAALGELRVQEGDALGARRPTILATGHAHLDTAWLWPLWRTHQKAAHTVATALSLMERYPDYHFSMSQPQVYSFLKRDDPELYARLVQRVAEGRFEPVGMMWIEADCNVPSGESLVRQFLYGKRFFDEEFGPAKHVLWLPDVFGYSAALPQILRGCGIDVFMTTKISWNQFNRMPCDTFRWRGIDGSEVLTHFVTATDQPLKPNPSAAQFYTYNGTMLPQEVFGTWNHYRQKQVNDEVLYLFGWGDGGGGPTEEMLELARWMSDLPGFPRVQLGRVEQYFERLTQRVWDAPDLPTWVGELYLEYHRGTYTSQAHTKQNNRASELLFREAEWLNAWAHTLGAPSRQAELDDGWRTILLNQFHDILPGSSVPLVYVESEQQFAAARAAGAAVRDAAAAFVLENDDAPTDASAWGQRAAPPQAPPADSTPVVVFNSLPWERREAVAVPVEHAPAGAASIGQTVEDFASAKALLVETSAPPYGYCALHAPESSGSPLVVRQDYLASDEYRIELDQHGEIASLYDARHEREIALPDATLNQLVVYEDRPMFWEAWDIDIFYEEKPYPIRDVAAWRVVEEGPLRAAIEITRRFGQSTIRQRICLWRTSRRIDFVTEVDWQERQQLLRALFPLRLNAARATCEIQYGAVERPTHRNTSWDVARFEVCAHRWVDMSEGGYGVALLNDGKYGHSLRDSTLGISLLKAGIHPDPEADRGLHRFTYSLLPHAGDWREGQVTRRAYELNAPLRAVAHGGQPAAASSFLSTDSDHVVVETVKVADDGDGLIVRLYEAHNQRGPLALRFGRPIASAVEVNLLEQEVGPVTVDGPDVRLHVRPFEVKTLRVRF